jgi:hypothetical protein
MSRGMPEIKMRLLILAVLASSLACQALPIRNAAAQSRMTESRVTREDDAGARYRYLFENDRFTTPRMEIEFDASGKGHFRFTRKGEPEIDNQLTVSSSLVARVQGLFSGINFLGSDEDYQFKKDFSHLGQISITAAQGGRERTATFNYTTNESMNQLVDIFRGIATQETRVFEIETVRTNDPISTPAQLRLLESELRSKRIAEPKSLVRLLGEIRQDESVPLIARNHAERLIQLINKGK